MCRHNDDLRYCFTRTFHRFLYKDGWELSKKDSSARIVEEVVRREDINDEWLFLFVQSTTLRKKSKNRVSSTKRKGNSVKKQLCQSPNRLITNKPFIFLQRTRTKTTQPFPLISSPSCACTSAHFRQQNRPE